MYVNANANVPGLPSALVVQGPPPNAPPAAPLAQTVPSHPVGLDLPDPGGAATNAVFQQPPLVPEPSLSERLQDPALKLSELRDMFNEALNGDEVDLDRPIAKLLYEIGARHGNTLEREMELTLKLQAALLAQDTPRPHDPRKDWEPMKLLDERQQAATKEATLQLQARLQLHRMLFAALGSRLPAPEADELRLLGGLLVEHLQRGWISEPMYRKSMHQLAERFLALTKDSPYRDLAIYPPRSALAGRGAYLDAFEREILKATRNMALAFTAKGRIADRDVPGVLTNHPKMYACDGGDETEMQKGVDRAAYLFKLFAALEGLPEGCVRETLAIMASRESTSEQIQQFAAASTPEDTAKPSAPEPSLNVPMPDQLPELARKTSLCQDFMAFDPYFGGHKVSLRELIDLLIYAHDGPGCRWTAEYEATVAMLRQVAETQHEIFPERAAPRELKNALFEVLRLRLDPQGQQGEKMKRWLGYAKDDLDRNECDYPTYMKSVRAVLRDFALSDEGRAGGVWATKTA